MEIKKLEAARGWMWIKQGWQLMMLNPQLSTLGALGGALILLLAMMLPGIGSLLAVLLLPFYLVANMRIDRALEEAEKFDAARLLAELKPRIAGLVTLGALLMLGLLLISSLMVSIGGEAFGKLMLEMQAQENPQLLMNALATAGKDVTLAIVVGFSLVLLLLVSWQYAPILLFFSGVPPLVALYASFVGTVRNVVPYTVYGLLMQVLAMLLGILPFGLGMLVLLPLTLTSLYVSYRNIFPWLDTAPAAPAAPTDMGV